MIALDVLRFAAIILVIFRHGPYILRSDEYGRYFFAIAARIGWQGVDLFFVLSGFLIGGLLFDELQRTQRIDVKRFLTRRAFKIWPLLLLLIVSTTIYVIATGSGPWNERCWFAFSNVIAPNVFLYANYLPFHLQEKAIIGQCWSLMVEEHFYLLLPALLVFITRRGITGLRIVLPMICVIDLFFCLIWKVVVFSLKGYADPMLVQTATHSRTDTLLLGVLLAYGVRFQSNFISSLRRYRLVLLAFGVLSFFPAALKGVRGAFFLGTAGFTITTAGCACLVLNAWWWDQERTHASLPVRLMARIGTWSYAIYLFHVPFVRDLFVVNHLALPWAMSRFDYGTSMILMIGLSILLGGLISILIERPVLALRNHLFPSRSDPFHRLATLQPSN